MQHAAEVRRCLTECDVTQMRKLWRHIAPHLPQPESDDDALVSIHFARTQSVWLAFKQRAYSHRWLCDNGWPSGLPDELKPKAERIYPRIVSGVGISVNARGELFKPIAKIVQGAIGDAVCECYADKRIDYEFVDKRMKEARQKTVKKLLGIIQNG